MKQANTWLIALALAASVLATSAPARAADKFQSFEPDDLARLVVSEHGKPFVLVLWSLDCTYCQASLKALASEQRRRKDLRVVTMATDTLTEPGVLPLLQNKLKKSGVRSSNWSFGSASYEQLRYAVDPKWHGEIPRSYWYRANGERVAYSGTITQDIVQKFWLRSGE